MNKQTPVNDETADLISMLHNRLQEQFGADFAYSITAKGHTVAASNMTAGHVVPASAAPVRLTGGWNVTCSRCDRSFSSSSAYHAHVGQGCK